MYIKVYINDNLINCLVDTGSTRTVLHTRKYLSIPEERRPKLIKNRVRLKTANGELIQTIGKTILSMRINDRCFSHQFLIADIDVPAVLGYDFLYSNNCKLDMGGGILTIEDTQILCQKESQMETIFKITVEENVILSPFSEVIVMGKVIGDPTHIANAIVEPDVCKPDSVESEMIIARALVDPSNGTIPLRIANISEKKKVIYRNKSLANCEACQTVSDNENTTTVIPADTIGRIDDKDETTDTITLPDHLSELFKISCSSLSTDQQTQLKILLQRHSDAFAKSKNDIGCSDLIEHKINTGDAAPIKQNPRRLPLSKHEDAKREINRMF